MIIFGIMLILAGVIVLIAAFSQWLQNRSYAACSASVMATVTRKTSRVTKRGRVYELYVAYTVDGVPYEKWVCSKADEFDGISEGGQVELRYKPRAPKHCVRVWQLSPKAVRALFIVGAVLTVVGVALYLAGYYM